MKLLSLKPLILILSAFLTLASCRHVKSVSHTSTQPETSERKESGTISKYAGVLGVPASSLSNTKLYEFINDWEGAPYLYGGKSKSGVDCSGFTEILYKNVYNRVLTGSSRDLFEQCSEVSKDKMKEGDLVFFKIGSDKISHVGVYLTNDKFVHATVKRGVMISDLKEAYYTKYYYKGGRLK